MKKLIITTGDPNGIGAEITIKALNNLNIDEKEILLISNKKVLDFYGKLNKNYEIVEIPFEEEISPGKITKGCGEFCFQSLKLACEIKGDGIVTAPVAKEALYLAGYKFNGQTEILQKYLAHDNQLAEMLFVADNFRVLLLTRHCALKEINITKELVIEKVKNLNLFFQKHFKIQKPKFALCALNPHASENGILGREEIEILRPAVKKLNELNIDITEPKPADTLFIKYGDYDCIIANYHDQGLIPIKTVAKDKTVNMTIGLDIIRTSPGHGTAFDIAGKNLANSTSMQEAIKVLRKLILL